MPPPPPPLLPLPSSLATDVEDDGDDEPEEGDGRNEGLVGCAIETSRETSSVDDDVAEYDFAEATEELEDITRDDSGVGDTDVEDEHVKDAALEAL